MTIPTMAAALIALTLPVAAGAQTAEADPTGAQPTAPTTASGPAPICTDRPSKANVACTALPGTFQLETDLVNWTRNTDAGVRTDIVAYTNPYLKYGLGTHTDIEVNIAPYVTARTSVGGEHTTIGGVGDLYVRLKQGLTPTTGKVQVALIPYVKAPTAKLGIGNRQWEGGAILPVLFTLPAGITLNVGPEIDILADGALDGRHHAQLVSLANLSKSFGKATVYAEFWNAHNFDPVGTVHQYSADVALAYLVTPKWQVDLGGNFGLNRFTPDAQVYLGLSTRF